MSRVLASHDASCVLQRRHLNFPRSRLFICCAKTTYRALHSGHTSVPIWTLLSASLGTPSGNSACSVLVISSPAPPGSARPSCINVRSLGCLPPFSRGEMDVRCSPARSASTSCEIHAAVRQFFRTTPKIFRMTLSSGTDADIGPEDYGAVGYMPTVYRQNFWLIFIAAGNGWRTCIIGAQPRPVVRL